MAASFWDISTIAPVWPSDVVVSAMRFGSFDFFCFFEGGASPRSLAFVYIGWRPFSSSSFWGRPLASRRSGPTLFGLVTRPACPSDLVWRCRLYSNRRAARGRASSRRRRPSVFLHFPWAASAAGRSPAGISKAGPASEEAQGSGRRGVVAGGRRRRRSTSRPAPVQFPSLLAAAAAARPPGSPASPLRCWVRAWLLGARLAAGERASASAGFPVPAAPAAARAAPP